MCNGNISTFMGLVDLHGVGLEHTRERLWKRLFFLFLHICKEIAINRGYSIFLLNTTFISSEVANIYIS